MITQVLRLALLLAFMIPVAGCHSASEPISPPEPPPALNSPTMAFITQVTVSSIHETEVASVIRPTEQALTVGDDVEPIKCQDSWCIYSYIPKLIRPVQPSANTLIDSSYPYGSTQNNQRERHDGVEITNPSGTPVLAAADGVVLFAGNDRTTQYGKWKNIYGNLVIIEHSQDSAESKLFTLYAHLSTIQVESGDRVLAGDSIGEVGATGAAIGSHLHFEVREGSSDVEAARNPLLYLPTVTGQDYRSGTLVASIYDTDNRLLVGKPVTLQAIENGLLNSSGARYFQTYEKGAVSSSFWAENLVVENLPPGDYRLTVMIDGRLIEHFLPVEPGNVTYLKLKTGE